MSCNHQFHFFFSLHRIFRHLQSLDLRYRPKIGVRTICEMEKEMAIFFSHMECQIGKFKIIVSCTHYCFNSCDLL